MDDHDRTREEFLEGNQTTPGRPAGPEAGRVVRPEAFGADIPAWIGRTLETLDDALFVLDRDWRFTYLNPQALRNAGEPAAALLGRRLWEKYPGLLGTPLEAHYRRAMAEQTPAHFEMPGLLSGRWLEVHAYPSPDTLVIYARDATERKRAEEALRESEVRFRQMAEAIDEVFWLTDADNTRLLYVSPAYEAVWGRTCRSLYEQPRSWLEAVHPADRERVRAAFQRQRQTGELHEEYRVVRPDGTIRWVMDRAFPVRDEQGRAYRAAGIAKDITDRKEAEEALRQSEGRLRRFFEAAFEGIVIHADGVVLDVNQAAADLFGYAPAELIGRPLLDLVAPEAHEVVRRHVLEQIETRYEAVGRRKDGSTFPYEVCGKSTTYQGRPARVSAARDITARKRAEAELREYAQRLQLLSRRLLEVQEEERRRLARELHDEVAQVLVGLNYGLELARRSSGEQRDATLAEAQALVKELARQVRDTSLLLRPTMLDDFGLGPALAWHCRRFTEQTGVRVDLEQGGLAGRLPAEVESAAYRIVQEALTNVARHAGVDHALVRVGQVPGRLQLSVEDGGAGFDAAAVLAAATGGGLAGMQERVALLGGRLTVTSKPGGGTRLTAELPLGTAGEG